MEVLVTITIIICLFTPAIAALVVHSDIEVDSIKTKIKDFFHSKHEEDNNMYCNPNKPVKPPSHSDTPEDEDLRAFKKELNNLDKEIKYAEELKKMQKEKRDKELHLERLCADEYEFEMLYILIHTEPSIWSPVSEYGSKWVKGVYQTRNEANEAMAGNYSDYQIVEFNYLPRNEEE